MKRRRIAGGLILAVLVVVLCFWGRPSPQGGRAPDARLRQRVEQINPRSFTLRERERLSAFYTAFADVAEADDGKTLTNAGRVRKLNILSGTRCFGEDLMKNHGSTAKEVDTVLAECLSGDCDLPETLRAIAWRFGHG